MSIVKSLKFTRESTFTGRNGYFKSSGIEVNGLTSHDVILTPITTRRKLGNGDIVIPMNDIPEFMNVLREVYNAVKEEELTKLRNELFQCKEYINKVQEEKAEEELHEQSEIENILSKFQ